MIVPLQRFERDAIGFFDLPVRREIRLPSCQRVNQLHTGHLPQRLVWWAENTIIVWISCKRLHYGSLVSRCAVRQRRRGSALAAFSASKLRFSRVCGGHACPRDLDGADDVRCYRVFCHPVIPSCSTPTCIAQKNAGTGRMVRSYVEHRAPFRQARRRTFRDDRQTQGKTRVRLIE